VADDINLPNLVSHLQVNLANTNGAIADAARQGSSMGAALGSGIQRELRDAVSNLPDVQIDGNTSDLDRDLARVRGELDDLANQRIGVDISIADALRELERLEPHLERLSATHPNIHVQATTRGALRQLAQLRQAARQVDDTDIDIDVDADTDDAERGMRRVHDALGRVVSIIPKLAGLAAPFAAAGVAAGALLPLVAALVASLSNIAPAAAVGVSAMLALQLATNTLKLAMVGVEDAIAAALDPEGAEAYAEAIKKLSPEARKFTDVLREMAPELDEFRRQVQDRVFADFSTELTRTAKSVLPALKTALLNTGDSLNAMAKGVAESARDLSDRGIFGQALDSATTSLESMEQVPGRITTSLGLLAAASGPSLERIAKKADEVSVRILESLTQSFESGELEGSIDGALELFEQMGRIVRNIFGGLKNIIGGVTEEAGSLFFILEELSAAFERLTASEEFQSILREIVQTADDLVKNVLPLLKEAFAQLAPVIEEIGPPLRDFINEIGPELKPLLQELGPILKDLAIIFREQLPFAIEVVKGAIQALTFVLGIVHWVLSNLVIPLVKKAAQVLNSDFVKALASASREASAKVGAIAAKFEQFRSAVASVMRTSAGKLWDFIGSVGRFAQGIASSMGEVINIFWEIPGAIRAAVGDLGSILWDAGWRVIGGLIAGVRARIGELRSLLNSVTNMIPDWKGPAEKDATLLTPNGRLLMEGLIAGIDATTGQLRSRLADITRSLPGMLAIPGITGGALSLASPGLLPAAAPAAAAGHTFNLYGADASPDGILRAMSWSALVGGTSG
jgi:phage-related protein